jgi:aryl-alcohol dehydrogenase-like predicted oxidoreductase
MKSCWSRRDFLKSTAAAVVLGAAEKTLGETPPPSTSLAKRRLGKTGEMVSIIGFGAGSRYCSIPDEDAEKRLGEFAKKRRKELVLATKFDPRDRDGALRSVERSLQLLQTDFLDLIQIHSLSDLNDLNRMDGPNGAAATVQKLKEQKVARFIGITGHNDGAAMTEALSRHDFDTVLMALNAAQSANPIAARKMEPIPAFEKSALPLALQKNVGVISMKVMGQGMLVGTGAGRASASELLQFNLSQPVACVVIGVEHMAPLEENVRAALNFTPISDSGKQKLQEKVNPSRSAWQKFLQSHDDSVPV